MPHGVEHAIIAVVAVVGQRALARFDRGEFGNRGRWDHYGG
jgi:hypothetical protein